MKDAEFCKSVGIKHPEPRYLFADILNPGPNRSRKPVDWDVWISFVVSMAVMSAIGMLLCWWGSKP